MRKSGRTERQRNMHENMKIKRTIKLIFVFMCRPRPQNDGRAFDHRPPTDSGFHLDNSMASTPQRYRGSEATSTFYNDGGSRSSASSRANKRNTLLQTV